LRLSTASVPYGDTEVGMFTRSGTAAVLVLATVGYTPVSVYAAGIHSGYGLDGAYLEAELAAQRHAWPA
jgi:hypothetical protein